MTLSAYEHEEARIINALLDEQPGTERYLALLQSYSGLLNAATYSIDAKERLAYAEEVDGEQRQAPNNVTEFPAQVEAPFPDPPETEEAETIPFEELKSRFVAAARSGIDVGEIISSAGYEKLSDIPASEYGAILDQLAEVT